jgi:hypothetical protein
MKSHICATIDSEIYSTIEKQRGLVPRSIYLNDILKAGLNVKGIELEK